MLCFMAAGDRLGGGCIVQGTHNRLDEFILNSSSGVKIGCTICRGHQISIWVVVTQYGTVNTLIKSCRYC